MPELPEVETITNGLRPLLEHSQINHVFFFRDDLRWVIPKETILKALVHNKILRVFRRSKYIIFETSVGYVYVHLGMSGKIHCYSDEKPKHPHTHWVLKFTDSVQKTMFLHYIDPRRFGMITARCEPSWEEHPLLSSLGVEPLETRNLGAYLWKKSRSTRQSIKSYIMNSKIVVGVGNIYACESLFLAMINPQTQACKLSKSNYQSLALSIKKILRKAIKAGGTTLQDFRSVSETPGYFAVFLNVYGRQGDSCCRCGSEIWQIKQTGRSTWFCSQCQC